MSEACEIPQGKPNANEIRDVLRTARTIAVVGLSDKPERDSYRVAAYLQRAGYRIFPVNPALREVLGEKSVASLRDLTESVDVVDVFRKADAVPEIVEDAIAIGAKVLWMQDGIVHNAAAEKARAAGMKVVMSRCLMRDHHALMG